MKEYNIPFNEDDKKEGILKSVLSFINEKALEFTNKQSANNLDLVKIGIALKNAFDEILSSMPLMDQVIIENQISPIANRMKTLQGMIAQFFIMHDKTNISFVSAANKLKGISCSGDEIKIDDGENNNTNVETGLKNYALRKKEGIKITQALIKEKYIQWLPHFNQHKKKDDLADAFLQGVAYLKR